MSDRRRQSQSGMTLVELSLVILFLSLVLTIALRMVISFDSALSRTDTRTQNTDQARLAVQQMDRQIRSGNVLYQPGADGMSFRVYTQANGNQKCVDWRVVNGDLQTRSWSEFWETDGNVEGWKTVSRKLVNKPKTATSVGSPVFSVDTSSAFGDRLVNLRVRVNSDPNEVKTRTAEFNQSVTGRNTEYNYSENVCLPVPPA